jgi:hypothetical protein
VAAPVRHPAGAGAGRQQPRGGCSGSLASIQAGDHTAGQAGGQTASQADAMVVLRGELQQAQILLRLRVRLSTHYLCCTARQGITSSWMLRTSCLVLLHSGFPL